MLVLKQTRATGFRLKPIFFQVKRHNLQILVRSKEQQAEARLSENRESKGPRQIMLSGEKVKGQRARAGGSTLSPVKVGPSEGPAGGISVPTPADSRP